MRTGPSGALLKGASQLTGLGGRTLRIHNDPYKSFPMAAISCLPMKLRRFNSNLATYKRGKGGRSSFSGMVVTLFGHFSYIGYYLANRLARLGSQLIIPYRHEPYRANLMKPMGDLGQIVFKEFHLLDEQSIYDAVKYSNVVINTINAQFETKNFNFYDVNDAGARRLARISREAGVEKFLHVTCLNASLDPPALILDKPSDYLISQQLGTDAVREEFPDAIIARVGTVHGQGSTFHMTYGNPHRQSFDVTLPLHAVTRTVPLWKRGTVTVKQPVFVGDVVKGITHALLDDRHQGKTFEMVGPYRYYLNDLVRYQFELMQYDSVTFREIWPLWKLKIYFYSMNPVFPQFSLDTVEREHHSDYLTGLPTLADLNVDLTCIEDRWSEDLRMARIYSYYGDFVGELPDARPPKRLTPADEGLTAEAAKLANFYQTAV